MSTAAIFAIVLALAVSAVLAFCLPIWASIGIALAAVGTVAIGGGALLAKATIAAGSVALAAWLARQYLRRRAMRRMSTEVKWLAIPEVKKERESERRAA